jgi:multiple sugar transport system ATP-binding protein
MNIIDTASLPAVNSLVGAGAGHDGFIGVRPENVVVKARGEGRLTGRVELIESLGSNTLIYANVAGSQPAGLQIVAAQNTRTGLHLGDEVGLDVAPASFHLFNRQGQTVAHA